MTCKIELKWVVQWRFGLGVKNGSTINCEWKGSTCFTLCNTVLIKLCQYAIKREIKILTSKKVFKYQFWIQQHNLKRLRKVSKQQNIIC